MKSHFFWILCLLFSVLCVGDLWAQNIVSTGVLLSKGGENRIEGARVLNLRNGSTVQSNSLGIFTINVNLGDTLQIVKEDYETARVVVSSKDAMIVHLEQRQATTLQQVDVYGDGKIRDLKQTQKEYRKQGSFYNGKPPVLAVIFNPISGFYELFGKGPRNAKKFNNYLNAEVQQSTVDSKFNRYLVEKYTPLRGDEVQDFMFKYRPDYKISQKWNTYESIDYVKKKYQIYAQEKASGKDVGIPDLNKIKVE